MGDFCYREMGSEGHFKLSVSKVLKAHLVIPRKKNASSQIRREGLEIWRLEAIGEILQVARSAQEGLNLEG